MNPDPVAPVFPDRRPTFGFWVLAVALCAAAFWIRLAVMIGPARIMRADEAYQTLEPAYFKIFGSGVMAWEWRGGLRSWLFPDFLAFLMRVSTLFHGGHAFYLSFISGVLALFATGSVALSLWVGWRYAGWIGALLCGAFVGFWPDMVFMSARTLLEIQSGNLLILAAGLALLPLPDATRRRFLRIGIIGFLLGLVLILRLQLWPALIIVSLRTAKAERRCWMALMLGAAAPVALLGLNDWYCWGTPFMSMWNNIDFNLIKGGADRFGISAPFAYLIAFIQEWPWLLAPMVFLFFAAGTVTAMLTAIAIVTIVSHTAIPHKEISFIYAALPPAMLAVGMGAATLVQKIEGRYAYYLQFGLAIATIPFLLILNWQQDRRSDRPYWYDAGHDVLPLWVKAGDDPGFCGIGIYGNNVPLEGTGGYSFLDHGGSLYTIGNSADMALVADALNYIMTDGTNTPPASFRKVACAGAICLLHRDGKCVPSVDAHRALLLPTFQKWDGLVVLKPPRMAEWPMPRRLPSPVLAPQPPHQ